MYSPIEDFTETEVTKRRTCLLYHSQNKLVSPETTFLLFNSKPTILKS